MGIQWRAAHAERAALLGAGGARDKWQGRRRRAPGNRERGVVAAGRGPRQTARGADEAPADQAFDVVCWPGSVRNAPCAKAQGHGLGSRLQWRFDKAPVIGKEGRHPEPVRERRRWKFCKCAQSQMGMLPKTRYARRRSSLRMRERNRCWLLHGLSTQTAAAHGQTTWCKTRRFPPGGNCGGRTGVNRTAHRSGGRGEAT